MGLRPWSALAQRELRVDKPRAFILATWPMTPGVHPRMLVRPDLLLSQSHRGPTFETEAPGPPLLSRSPVQGHRGGLRERRSSRSVRGHFKIEGLRARSSNDKPGGVNGRH